MVSSGLYVPEDARPRTGNFPACTPRPSPSLPLNTIDRRSPVIRLTLSCTPRRSSRSFAPLSIHALCELSVPYASASYTFSPAPLGDVYIRRATSATADWILELRPPWRIGYIAPSTIPAQTRDRRLEATSPDPTPLQHLCGRSQVDKQRPLSIEAKPTLLGRHSLASAHGRRLASRSAPWVPGQIPSDVRSVSKPPGRQVESPSDRNVR